MSIDEYIERLNRAIDVINRDRGKELIKIGLDARALIRRRVINTGELADGSSMGTYSDAKVPFYYYYNKTRTGSDAALKRAVNQYGPLISYKEFREANNLKTDVINLSFTGAMFRDVMPRVERSTNDSTTLVLGPVQDRNKKLFRKHSRRFGQPILDLNQDEQQMIREANRRRVTKALNQTGIS